MKAIKIYVFLFSLVVFGSGATLAQRPAGYSKLVTENIVESLQHDVDGVVEATIYNSLFLSKYYPDAQIGDVLDELNEIAVNSKNPTIRYKAQLAVLYLTNYGNENLDLKNYKEDQSELFREISQRLQSSLLVSSK